MHDSFFAFFFRKSWPKWEAQANPGTHRDPVVGRITKAARETFVPFNPYHLGQFGNAVAVAGVFNPSPDFVSIFHVVLLSNYLKFELVFHEDRRHFNAGQVCNGVENLVSQSHELKLDGSGGRPNLNLGKLIGRQALRGRSLRPRLLAHVSELPLHQVLGDELGEHVMPLDMYEALTDPTLAHATSTLFAFALNANVADCHRRLFFQSS